MLFHKVIRLSQVKSLPAVSALVHLLVNCVKGFFEWVLLSYEGLDYSMGLMVGFWFSLVYCYQFCGWCIQF